MSFRLRVTLLAAAAVALAVAASAAVVYVVVRHQLLGEVDSSLVSRAHGFIEHPPPGLRARLRPARAAGQPRRAPDVPPGDRLHRPGQRRSSCPASTTRSSSPHGRAAVLHRGHGDRIGDDSAHVRVYAAQVGDGVRASRSRRSAGRGRPHAPPARAVHADHRARRRRHRRRARPASSRPRRSARCGQPHRGGGGGDRDPRPHPPDRRRAATTSSAGSRRRSTRCSVALDASVKAQRQPGRRRLARAAHAALEPAHEHRGARRRQGAPRGRAAEAARRRDRAGRGADALVGDLVELDRDAAGRGRGRPPRRARRARGRAREGCARPKVLFRDAARASRSCAARRPSSSAPSPTCSTTPRSGAAPSTWTCRAPR